MTAEEEIEQRCQLHERDQRMKREMVLRYWAGQDDGSNIYIILEEPFDGDPRNPAPRDYFGVPVLIKHKFEKRKFRRQDGVIVWAIVNVEDRDKVVLFGPPVDMSIHMLRRPRFTPGSWAEE